ncbi:hypothetical protein R1flu_009857 [Riccia fluitans]|uniref:Uncharacterized protein n=1 Tax=Riccia fluitans TaxID=41844 RepID=A0ABD1Z3C1_9MARC
MESRSSEYYKVLILGVVVVLLVCLRAASARSVILVLEDEALKEKDSDECQVENGFSLQLPQTTKLASTAMASFRSSKEAPLLEPVRLNDGSEESMEFKKLMNGGEDDDEFQFSLYIAYKGFALAMYRLGFIYYLGL